MVNLKIKPSAIVASIDNKDNYGICTFWSWERLEALMIRDGWLKGTEKIVGVTVEKFGVTLSLEYTK